MSANRINLHFSARINFVFSHAITDVIMARYMRARFYPEQKSFADYLGTGSLVVAFVCALLLIKSNKSIFYPGHILDELVLVTSNQAICTHPRVHINPWNIMFFWYKLCYLSWGSCTTAANTTVSMARSQNVTLWRIFKWTSYRSFMCLPFSAFLIFSLLPSWFLDVSK